MAKDAARVSIQSQKMQPPAPLQTDAASRSNADLQAADKQVQQAKQMQPPQPVAPAGSPAPTPVQKPTNSLGIPGKTEAEANGLNALSNFAGAVGSNVRKALPRDAANKVSGQVNDVQAKTMGVTNWDAVKSASQNNGQYAGTEIYGDNKQPPQGGFDNSRSNMEDKKKPDVTPEQAKKTSETVSNIISQNPNVGKDVIKFVLGIGDAIAKGKSFYAGNYGYKTISEKDLDKLREVQGELMLQQGLVPVNKANVENKATANIREGVDTEAGKSPYELALAQQAGENAVGAARVGAAGNIIANNPAQSVGIGDKAQGLLYGSPGAIQSPTPESIDADRKSKIKSLLENTNKNTGSNQSSQSNPSKNTGGGSGGKVDTPSSSSGHGKPGSNLSKTDKAAMDDLANRMSQSKTSGAGGKGVNEKID